MLPGHSTFEPRLGHRQLKQHPVVPRGRHEGVVSCHDSLVRLLVDELAADTVPGGQVADRLRTGQRLNDQGLAVASGQSRRCASTLIQLAPPPKL